MEYLTIENIAKLNAIFSTDYNYDDPEDITDILEDNFEEWVTKNCASESFEHGETFKYLLTDEGIHQWQEKQNEIYSVLTELGIEPDYEITGGLSDDECNIKFLVCDFRYDEGIRIRKDNISPCLTTKSISKSLSGKPLVIINGKMRQLTHFEILKLMGFDKNDYEKTIENGISESQISKQAGNSIVVDVLYYILLEIYNSMPYLLEDIKLSSFFSGIGAFEKAIIKLQDNTKSNNINNNNNNNNVINM